MLTKKVIILLKWGIFGIQPLRFKIDIGEFKASLLKHPKLFHLPPPSFPVPSKKHNN